MSTILTFLLFSASLVLGMAIFITAIISLFEYPFTTEGELSIPQVLLSIEIALFSLSLFGVFALNR
ncbi:MAG: hypothetical protein WC045_00715 [Patescibacteria group bacterium]